MTDSASTRGRSAERSCPAPLRLHGFIPSRSSATAVAKIVLSSRYAHVREWMYPRSAEVYQLLAKAVHITSNWTEGSVLPVLVCRRANPILIYMAKHLGFHVIEVINQVVDMKRMGGPETAERRFREVRSVRVWGCKHRIRSGQPALRPAYLRR